MFSDTSADIVDKKCKKTEPEHANIWLGAIIWPICEYGIHVLRKPKPQYANYWMRYTIWVVW